MEKGQELFSSLCARAHAPKHTASSGSAAGLLHTTHHHAEMRGLHHNTNTERLQYVGNGKGNLFRQALLHLESPGEHLRQTGQFGETQNPSVRNIPDMHLRKGPLAMDLVSTE